MVFREGKGIAPDLWVPAADAVNYAVAAVRAGTITPASHCRHCAGAAVCPGEATGQGPAGDSHPLAGDCRPHRGRLPVGLFPAQKTANRSRDWGRLAPHRRRYGCLWHGPLAPGSCLPAACACCGVGSTCCAAERHPWGLLSDRRAVGSIWGTKQEGTRRRLRSASTCEKRSLAVVYSLRHFFVCQRHGCPLRMLFTCLLHRRQREPQNRPFTRRAFDPDSTALHFYQALSNSQVETCAGSQTFLCASLRA